MSENQFPTSVSAVLATYNRTKYLAECVESLLNQKLPLHELIVVDDGSDEDPTTVLQPYADRIRLFRKENGGRATALNYGIERASGDWLWFFDDDDVALPDATERMLNALQRNPGAHFVFSGNHNGFDGQDGRIEIRDTHLPNMPPPGELLLRVLIRYDFRTQGMLIRRTCFERMQPFDVAFLRSQDYEFIARLLHQFEGVCLPEPTFIWRHHEGLRGPKGLEHTVEEREKVWLKFDSMLGQRVRSHFALGDFLVPRIHSDSLPPHLLRAALINRMAIMASKGLIDETLQDALLAAAVVAPDTSWPKFTPNEWRMCIETVLHPYFRNVLAQDANSFLNGLRQANRTTALRSIAAGFARGILYSIRWDTSWRLRLAKLGYAARLFWLAGPNASLNAYIHSKQPHT